MSHKINNEPFPQMPPQGMPIFIHTETETMHERDLTINLFSVGLIAFVAGSFFGLGWAFVSYLLG